VGSCRQRQIIKLPLLSTSYLGGHLGLPITPTHPQGPDSRDGEQEALLTLAVASGLLELLHKLGPTTDWTPILAGVGVLTVARILIMLWRERIDR